MGTAAGLFPNLQIDLVHALGSYLFVPVPSPSGGHHWPVLVQGWTLNYEIFFYLVFAAALLAPCWGQLPWLAGALLMFVVARTFGESDNPLLVLYTEPLILEFAAGAWLGRLWLRGMMPRPSLAC